MAGGGAHGSALRRYAQPVAPSPRNGVVHLLEPDAYGRDGGLLPHASIAFQRGLPVAAVCDEGASYIAEYSCDGDGQPVSGILMHGDIRTEISVSYF